MFWRLCQNDRRFVDELLNMLAGETTDTLRRLVSISASTCRSRFEDFLVTVMSETNECRPDGSLRMLLPLTVTELADLVLVSREHMSRVVSELEAERLICRDRGWFIIPAGSALMRRIR
jgi:CRP-like cAMP-binding protein